MANFEIAKNGIWPKNVFVKLIYLISRIFLGLDFLKFSGLLWKVRLFSREIPEGFSVGFCCKIRNFLTYRAFDFEFSRVFSSIGGCALSYARHGIFPISFSGCQFWRWEFCIVHISVKTSIQCSVSENLNKK